ncbi:MAG: hypothetical protein RLZZ428_202, partial [Pseudomonadota bacterium]
ALLIDTLLKEVELPEAMRAFLNDLDIGNISAETNVGEEELEMLRKSLLKKSRFSLVVGADLYAHPRAQQIAKLLALLEKYAAFNVVCVPPSSNALGVALICDLDDAVEGKTLGYNVKGHFTLSALGDGDLDMPAMNQQEGTVTTVDKRVVPMNVALAYGGYVLNDLANALGFEADYTIEYTEALPVEKGFKSQGFDTLPDYFDITGKEHRGYLLERKEVVIDDTLEEIEAFNNFDGAVIYNCNIAEQFSPFTNLCKPLEQEPFLRGSQQFATAAKLHDSERISFTIDGVVFTRVFKIDTSMKGTIALNPTYDMGLSSALVSSYRFCQLDFTRIGS